jgi:hypothetical protein
VARAAQDGDAGAVKTFRFLCASCDAEVGRLEVAPDGVPLPFVVGPPGHQGDLDDGVGTRIQWTYPGRGVRRGNSDEDRRAVSAFERGDPRRIARIDGDLIPFYCHRCKSWYCPRHWKTRVEYEDDEPGNPYRSAIHHGTCPRGHRRELYEPR